MTRQAQILNLIMLATCTAANAQVGGTAFWQWQVMTEDGDGVVEPGEHATVTLSIDMSPDVAPGGPVQGFAQSTFDVVGGNEADTGEIVDWHVLSNLDLLGDTAEKDGVSLFGVFAGQVAGDVFNDDDPIDVFEFMWKPDVYDERVIEYSTFSFLDNHGENLIVVWEGKSVFDAEPFLWPIEEASISFQVVPAPAGALMLAGALAGTCGRRRR